MLAPSCRSTCPHGWEPKELTRHPLQSPSCRGAWEPVLPVVFKLQRCVEHPSRWEMASAMVSQLQDTWSTPISCGLPAIEMQLGALSSEGALSHGSFYLPVASCQMWHGRKLDCVDHTSDPVTPLYVCIEDLLWALHQCTHSRSRALQPKTQKKKSQQNSSCDFSYMDYVNNECSWG